MKDWSASTWTTPIAGGLIDRAWTSTTHVTPTSSVVTEADIAATLALFEKQKRRHNRKAG